MNEVSIHLAGDCSVLVRFGDQINPEILGRVRGLLEVVSKTESLKTIFTQVQPAYTSVLLTFNPLHHNPLSVIETLKKAMGKIPSQKLPKGREREIPTWYGGAAGPDLEDVAHHTGLTPEEIIHKHSNTIYYVYFLGFSPGFAYLGGLPQELATPRLPEARKAVPPGSVGIGGLQTGIYPLPTPGGWRLIGRTNVEIFSPDKNPMALFEMGDIIRFRSITAAEFEKGHQR